MIAKEYDTFWHECLLNDIEKVKTTNTKTGLKDINRRKMIQHLLIHHLQNQSFEKVYMIFTDFFSDILKFKQHIILLETFLE